MAFFQSIKEAFVKNKDKDKYLSGLGRSRKSFGDRLRALSNSFNGVNDELLEQIMIILLWISLRRALLIFAIMILWKIILSASYMTFMIRKAMKIYSIMRMDLR